MTTKKDVLECYCNDTKPLGLEVCSTCQGEVNDPACYAVKQLSAMLDSLLDGAPCKMSAGKTGRVIGHNMHCSEVAEWVKKVKGEEKPVCTNCIYHATDDTRCLTCQGEYFRARDTPVCPRCNGRLKVPVEGTDDFADCPICQDLAPSEIEELRPQPVNNMGEVEEATQEFYNKINELVRECKSLRQAVNWINQQGGGR